MMGMVGLDAQWQAATVKFLNPPLPSSSFSFSELPDVLEVQGHCLPIVTATDRTYPLTKREKHIHNSNSLDCKTCVTCMIVRLL